MQKVSIVIPVYNHLKMTIDCLNDLIKTCDFDLEIIVVDDCSKENVSKIIPKLFPNVVVLKNDLNVGFAKTVNKGILASTSDYICLLNNDVKIKNAKWLGLMMGSLNSFDLTSPAGGKMDANWNYIPGEAKSNKEMFSYLVGWCLLVKKNVFDKIGLIPECFGKGFFEDVLFSYRAKNYGFRLGITENVGIEHMYHTTFKNSGYDINKEYVEKRKIFLKEIGFN